MDVGDEERLYVSTMQPETCSFEHEHATARRRWRYSPFGDAVPQERPRNDKHHHRPHQARHV